MWKKLKNNDGVTAVEYGFLVACVSVVMMTAMASTGHDIKNLFETLSNTFIANGF